MRLGFFGLRLLAGCLLASCSLPLASALGREQTYLRWLNEEVRWIITQPERADFLKLATDQQRDDFVVAFWARRDPPGAPENQFKHEHYRRLAFANRHFASNTPGWRSDRGRIYIVYGPPDQIEHLSALEDDKAWLANDGMREAFPSEIWRYDHVRNVVEVKFLFVDHCKCGDYRLKSVPSQINLLPQAD